jgi:hypothetical protein
MCIEEEEEEGRQGRLRECTIEAHSGVQCAVRRIKQRNKEKNKVENEAKKKG